MVSEEGLPEAGSSKPSESEASRAALNVVIPPQLPYTFEVASPNLASTIFTILQTTNALDLDKLPIQPVTYDSIMSVDTAQSMISLKLDVHIIVKALAANYMFVKRQNLITDKDSRYCIMFHFHNNCYIILELPHGIRFKELSKPYGKRIKDFHAPWDMLRSLSTEKAHQEKGTSSEQVELFNTGSGNSEENGVVKPSTNERVLANFSMKPPKPDTVSPTTSNVVHEQEPYEFLCTRYFSTLYSLNTPLSYFPKTALSRLRILCKDRKEMGEILEKSMFSIEDIDSRYLRKYDIYSSDESNENNDEFETKARKEFIAKHPFLNDEEQTEKSQQLFLELKIREAQLQILQCLELFECWEIDEEKFIQDCQKEWKKEREKHTASLVRPMTRKRTKKRKGGIMPTFLGMGVITSVEQTSTTTPARAGRLSIFKLFDTLLDRMKVWDTLLERASTDDKDSTYGFLVYVLVPYFNKRLPKIIKYVIDKVKDLNIKLATKSFRTFEKEARSRLKASLFNSVEPGDSSSEQSPAMTPEASAVPKPSKYKKTLIAPHKLPSLRKAKTSSLSSGGGDLMPPISLKRSKSNLSSKNLQKREVDMSLAKVDPKNDANEKPTNGFIFGNAKKLKSMLTLQGPSKLAFQAPNKSVSSFSQVQATPMKPKSILETRMISPVAVASTPLKEHENMRNKPNAVDSPVAQIAATPIRPTSDTIQQTPQSQFVVPPSSKKSLKRKLVEAFTDEVQSPQEIKLPEIIMTPANPVSSPLDRIKSKPGQQVLVLNSPFYSSATLTREERRFNGTMESVAFKYSARNTNETLDEKDLSRSLLDSPTRKLTGDDERAMRPSPVALSAQISSSALVSGEAGLASRNVKEDDAALGLSKDVNSNPLVGGHYDIPNTNRERHAIGHDNSNLIEQEEARQRADVREYANFRENDIIKHADNVHSKGDNEIITPDVTSFAAVNVTSTNNADGNSINDSTFNASFSKHPSLKQHSNDGDQHPRVDYSKDFQFGYDVEKSTNAAPRAANTPSEVGTDVDESSDSDFDLLTKPKPNHITRASKTYSRTRRH